MSDENRTGYETGTERPDEYSVGPLDHSTWLVLYEMCSKAVREEDNEELLAEYREAKREFLMAHPADSIENLGEDWSEEMKESWNEMILGEIEDL